MTPRRRIPVSALVCAAWLAARPAGAQSGSKEPVDSDLEQLRGFGTLLDFRGVGAVLETDVTVTDNGRQEPLAVKREGGEVILLPYPGRDGDFWAFTAAVRTALVVYGTEPGSTSSGGAFLSNIEPTFGLVIDAQNDQLRLELDVGPALAYHASGQLDTQAALAAALATGPHDDLLFLPNLKSAGRIRAAAARRWVSGCAAASVRAEVQAGHADTTTIYGGASGGVGGGDVEGRLYYRTLKPWLEGLHLGMSGDVGYTSVWSSDVVLPIRLAWTLGAAFTRTLELRFLGGVYSYNISNLNFGSWFLTLGVRVGLGGWK